MWQVGGGGYKLFFVQGMSNDNIESNNEATCEMFEHMFKVWRKKERKKERKTSVLLLEFM
jgi:hypothetical protein